jgi:hypothetical protein
VLGVKFDNAKPRWYLLPIKQVEDVVRVLTVGAAKYQDNNWKKVDNSRERYYSACLRHLSAWRQGNIFDGETGLPHLAHAICCLLFMMWFDNREKGSMVD